MKKNIFGTDGVRGPVGVWPLTPEAICQMGKAIAHWACNKYGPTPRILLAHDTRLSCSIVKAALKSGMLVYPITVFDAQVLPSPAVVQLLSKSREFDAGIIISASHNPYQDNGIKIIDGAQGKLSLDDEQLITELFLYQSNASIGTYVGWGTDLPFFEALHIYKKNIMNFFAPNFLQEKKIVLDSAHGAAFSIAPDIMRSFGATVIMLHDMPNGKNINDQCGALHPHALAQAVVQYGADAGFAFDGDADRVIAVNSAGHIKDGDDILALLLQHATYQHSPAIVGTSMSNQGLEQFLGLHNKQLIRTAVGDKYINAALNERQLLLGGEPSGHIIARDYLNTGDGIFIALRVLETMMLANNWTMQSFIKFPQIILNVPIRTKKDLGQEPLVSCIDQAQQQLHKGRLVVRYSGTEQLIRIMVEDEDYEFACMIGTLLSQQLALILNEDTYS